MRDRIIFFLKISPLFLLVGFFIFYFFYQTRAFFFGPKIAIENPRNGQSFDDSFVEIKGVSSNTNFFSIDGKVILIDEEGHFNKSLLLAKGYNIIELSAKDKFGREDRKKLEVVLK